MKTEFFKMYGAAGRQDGLRKLSDEQYVLFYGFEESATESQQTGQPSEERVTGWCWRRDYDHEPTDEELQEDLHEVINMDVQNAILSGFSYRGRMVWLSSENQRNIAFAYALAKGGDLDEPFTLKLGTDDDYEFYTFADASEVVSFAKSVQRHIEGCIAKGRVDKCAINLQTYRI